MTRYQYAVTGVEQELAIAVAPEDPVKLAVLTITNSSLATKRLCLFGYVEWCLGPPRAGERRFVTTECDPGSGAIFASNVYNTEFKDHVAFLHATERARSYTCDRAEFVGRNRTLARPRGLYQQQLGARSGAGLDACGALQIELSIAPQETRRVAFVLGQGRDRVHARQLADRYASLALVEATPSTGESDTRRRAEASTVSTPGSR